MGSRGEVRQGVGAAAAVAWVPHLSSSARRLQRSAAVLAIADAARLRILACSSRATSRSAGSAGASGRDGDAVTELASMAMPKGCTTVRGLWAVGAATTSGDAAPSSTGDEGEQIGERTSTGTNGITQVHFLPCCLFVVVSAVDSMAFKPICK